ncbi:exonuclease [Bordetella genomosp. 9]|uniref:lambda exonuclease family protein n=1 Tax=Bordetella genomosp. 9 TaxID=1416803 RepID=UPI000A293263|nr:lambda exonuclease family protein [Bordetella genomosp. 9]ARP89789.1 exonuclease [Bordetella genomosp. 9]
MDQRTIDWFQARLGKATASNFKKILAKVKTGEAADRRNYRAQLVIERLTGQHQESYSNAAMQWGTEQEPFARIAYMAQTGNEVQEVGFIEHETLLAGASPDGLVGDTGLVEIKCPVSATHIETLKSGICPNEHYPQVQGQLWITGRDWCDFVSYDPRMPERLQLFMTRVGRDPDYIDMLAKEVQAFLDEVAAEVETLNRIAA